MFVMPSNTKKKSVGGRIVNFEVIWITTVCFTKEGFLQTKCVMNHEDGYLHQAKPWSCILYGLIVNSHAKQLRTVPAYSHSMMY